ncbi:MAG: hypothetical protein E3J66_03210 [Dehalococcoidia bacterium]|nr:MAG: hypothetical protein E3J66_03210 [Dehalococcoidia bacterium]
MVTDIERFEKAKKRMDDAFQKATLARQPEIERLREQKREIDQKIYQMQRDILEEVLFALKDALVQQH